VSAEREILMSVDSWPDNQPDKCPGQRPEPHQTDAVERLARVRTAGSNPVVRFKTVRTHGYRRRRAPPLRLLVPFGRC